MNTLESSYTCNFYDRRKLNGAEARLETKCWEYFKSDENNQAKGSWRAISISMDKMETADHPTELSRRLSLFKGLRTVPGT